MTAPCAFVRLCQCLVVMFGLGCAPAMLWAAEDPPKQVIQMQLAGQDDTEPQLGYGNCQWLHPLDVVPEKDLVEPEYRSQKPVYYAAEFGDTTDNVFVFVIDESGGTGRGYDVVYVDANNDNQIDSKTERFEFRMSTTSRDDPLRIRLSVTAGNVTAPYFVNFTAFPYSDEKHLIEKVHVNLRNSSYYQGKAELLGRRRTIAIADLDSNGMFNDVERRLFQGDRLFVDLGGGLFSRGKRMESFPYGGFTRIDGVWHWLAASPDGSRVEIVRKRPSLGKIQVPSSIVAARLTSPTQALDLKFEKGVDDAVAGNYRIHTVQLIAAGGGPDGWTLQGQFGDEGPELTVTGGQTTKFDAGLPLVVQPQVNVDEERTLQINLQVHGIAGEVYRWRPPRGEPAQAGFDIVDSSGDTIASDVFEYG